MVRSEGCHLDAMLLSTLITKLVRLAMSAANESGSRALVLELLPSVALLCLHCLPWFRPQQLANVLYGFAKLRYHPGSSWMSSYLASVEKHIAGYRAYHLAISCWALATLGIQPPRSCMNNLFQESHDKMHTFKPQDFSNMIWAIAVLGRTPGALWAEAFFGLSGPLLSAFKPQELSNTLWGVAKVSLRPPPLWTETYFTVARGVTSSMSEQQVLNISWASTCLHLPQACDWLLSNEKKYTMAHPLAVTCLLLSCAHHQVPLSHPICWAAAASFIRMIPHCSHRQLTNGLWAMGKLGGRLSRVVEELLYRETARRMPALQHGDIAQLLYAFLKLGLCPPSWLLSNLLARMWACLHDRPRHLALVMYVLGQMGYRPDQTWMTNAMRAIMGAVGDLNPVDLTCLFSGWLHLGVRPRKYLLRALMEGVEYIVVDMDGTNLCMVLVAAVRWGHEPEQEWLNCMRRQACVVKPSLTCRQRRLIGTSLQKLKDRRAVG